MISTLAIVLTLFRMVVIPAQFPDREFSLDSLAVAERIAQAQEYFSRQFCDGSRLEFEQAGPVTLSKPSSYYGANYTDRKDVLLHEAIREACRLSQGIDFSRFDGDSDGSVDNIILLYAGCSEDEGAGADFIYQQHSHLSSYGSSLSLGGKIIDSFSVCSELALLEDGSTSPAGIGVFCHEVAHALGLLDMYDSDAEGSGGKTDGLNGTSLMDRGCKRGDGNSPPDFSAPDYELLGLGSPEPLEVGTYTLQNITKSGQYLVYESGTKGEYYLFCCGEGDKLYIYHIDKSSNDAGFSDYYARSLTAAQRWDLGQINCNPAHPCAQLVACLPDESQTVFGSDTAASFRFWSGHTSTLALVAIESAEGRGVSFKAVEPVSIDTIIPYQDAATFFWSVDPSLPYNQGFELICNQEEYKLPSSTRSFTIEKLSPLSEYELTLRVKLREGEFLSTSKRFSTKIYRPNTHPYIYLSGVARNKDGSFPRGTRLPLRIFNSGPTEEVQWYYDGAVIHPDSDGCFAIPRSGTLKAVIIYPDGSREIIIKEIVI